MIVSLYRRILFIWCGDNFCGVAKMQKAYSPLSLVLCSITAVFVLTTYDCNVAGAAEVVCLGASNTYGYAVQRGEDYPSQLERMLHEKGINVQVLNAGHNGDTSWDLRKRYEGVIGPDTRVVLMGVGGDNDNRKHVGLDETKANRLAIEQALSARHIKVIEYISTQPSFPTIGDAVHLTPDGYRMLAQQLLPKVIAALRR